VRRIYLKKKLISIHQQNKKLRKLKKQMLLIVLQKNAWDFIRASLQMEKSSQEPVRIIHFTFQNKNETNEKNARFTFTTDSKRNSACDGRNS
jgi:hypothetical protein